MTKALLRPKSDKAYKSACKFFPGGVNSPVRAFIEMNLPPLVAHSGFGDRLVDIDQNSYIDFCCSWGALIHGHAHPEIVKSVKRQIDLGSSFGLNTESEQKLARLIISSVPSCERIRFVSSGTEATMSAVRLARGFTGRDIIIKFNGHYHGHADSFLVQAGSGASSLASSAGIPKDIIKNTLSLPFNDFELCKRLFEEIGDKVAAVILEPIAANMGLVLPKNGFLEMLRYETSRVGALLIFDEVITGFRVALGGAQELYAIYPDLTCFGKIIGGGFPVAAFGGRADVMNCLSPLGSVYQAGTLSGNPVAMEAGVAALTLCKERKDFYSDLEVKTKKLLNHIRNLGLNICINQAGSLFTIFFGQSYVDNFDDAKKSDKNLFRKFFYNMLERGIYFSPSQYESNFVSAAHDEESINYTASAMVDALSKFCCVR